MYRPNQNDTVSVNLEDIDKITKVMVNPNATAKEKKKDSTMTTGRYNNKNVLNERSGGQVGDSKKGSVPFQKFPRRKSTYWSRTVARRMFSSQERKS